MKTIFYNRNCSGCKQPRILLERNKVKYESIDVRENPMDFKTALPLIKKSTRLIGISGKKITEIDLKKNFPTDEELKKIIIGRSGTLRAPCLSVDRTFVAGYNADIYKKLI